MSQNHLISSNRLGASVFQIFSLNRPTWPIQSLSRDVCVSSVCVSETSLKTRFPETSGRMTHDTWHKTCDTWHKTLDTWDIYFLFLFSHSVRFCPFLSICQPLANTPTTLSNLIGFSLSSIKWDYRLSQVGVSVNNRWMASLPPALTSILLEFIAPLIRLSFPESCSEYVEIYNKKTSKYIYLLMFRLPVYVEVILWYYDSSFTQRKTPYISLSYLQMHVKILVYTIYKQWFFKPKYFVKYTMIELAGTYPVGVLLNI